MATETVHFSISGEFITDHVRNLWGEKSFSLAIKTLETLNGATHEQYLDILFGRKKLAGVNLLDLVDDSWTPPPGYVSYADAIKQGENHDELMRYREDRAWELARMLMLDRVGSKGDESVFNAIHKLVGDAKAEEICLAVRNEIADKMRDEKGGGFLEFPNKTPRPSGIAAGNAALASITALTGQSVEGMMNRGFGKKPVLDPEMKSKSGWLLPEGKYYGCLYMEHSGTAHELLKEKHPAIDCETCAEKYGWVKIASGPMGLYVLCQRSLTKKQQAKLFDYAQRHGLDYEKITATLEKD